MMRGTRKKGAHAEILKQRLPVLIVDNDSFLADSFQMILEDAGFYVETAATGEEALTKADAIPFRLVITDLKLPDIRGVELSKLIKEKIPGVSVVLLSGMSNVEKMTAGGGLDHVLTKPINPLELLRVSNSFKTHM
jgi:DNA-binding response OmpR family regulator